MTSPNGQEQGAPITRIIINEVDHEVRLPVAHAYNDDLARLDAVSTIDALDCGELSVSEVQQGAIERAHKVDPQIHAVMFERYDAAASDPIKVRDRRGTFVGVPTFIKDMVPVAGLPCTWDQRRLRKAHHRRGRGLWPVTSRQWG